MDRAYEVMNGYVRLPPIFGVRPSGRWLEGRDKIADFRVLCFERPLLQGRRVGRNSSDFFGAKGNVRRVKFPTLLCRNLKEQAPSRPSDRDARAGVGSSMTCLLLSSAGVCSVNITGLISPPTSAFFSTVGTRRGRCTEAEGSQGVT